MRRRRHDDESVQDHDSGDGIAEEAARPPVEVVAQLLPILDNFERALESSEGQQNPQAFADGVRMIYRQLSDTLKKAGLETIPTEGEPFDPTVHEAIMQVEPGEGQAPHEVVEELRKGYKLNGRLLRAALVKVTSG